LGNFTVFVGCRPYRLTEQEARRLTQLRRGITNDEAATALRFAWALELMVGEGLDEAGRARLRAGPALANGT
jgi:hypothetical protein